MAEEVRIDLKSTADTSGAKQMESAIGGLAGKTQGAADGLDRAGKGSKDMARGLGEGAAAGNAAVAAMSQLSTATQGGASGMLALARGAFAAGVSLKAVLASMGPVGAIAAVIGVALGALSLVFKKSEDDAESMRKKVDELNKSNLEALKTQLDGITTAAKDGANALTEEAAIADRFADAKLSRDKAALEAEAKSTGMSDEVKSRKLLEMERAREDQRINQTKETKEKIARIEEDAAVQLAQKQIDADARLNQALSAKPEYNRLKDRERDLMLNPNVLTATGMTPEIAELANIRTKAEALKKKLPEIEARIPGLTDEKATADKDARIQAQAANKSRAAADSYAAEQDKLKELTGQKRGFEDRAKAGQTPAEKAALEKEKARIAAIPKSVLDNQVASGLYTNEAAYSAIRGDDNWRKFNRGQQQSSAASANQLQLGGGALAPTADPRIQLGGGPLGQGAVDPRNQVTRGELKPGSDNKLAGAADKITEAAGKNETSASGAKDALGQIAEGSVKIADSQSQLSEQIRTTANDQQVAYQKIAELSSQNVQAYAELSAYARDLGQKIQTLQSQLSAERARSRK